MLRKLRKLAKRPFTRVKKGKLVVMRHGQTDDNLKHIDTAQNNIPLTAVGVEEARAAGPLISDIDFDIVLSSPLDRAVDTAAHALEAAGTQKHLQKPDGSWKIEKRQELIEQNDGILTGRYMGDPVVVDYFKHSVFDSAPPGGESDKELVKRVKKFYDEKVLPRLARGENVLLAAHTGTIRALDIAMGLSPCPEGGKPWKNRRPVPNAGPDVHEYENGVLKKTYALQNPVTTKVDKELKEKREREKKLAEQKLKEQQASQPKP